jgi:formylglycine-generating enzyme required for sulfatase activity/class 3 adenylate cyclase
VSQQQQQQQPSEGDRAIRLASIVSIDIAGFSTMSEKDQRKAARKVESLRTRIERVANAHGGRVFNTAGDGFMLEFASAGSALSAIQEILDRPGRGEPPIRVGAHVGDVIVTATDDLLGHGVNVAARLQELAEPGAALVSSEFRSMARSSPKGAFQSKGQKGLDNIDQRVETFEILSRRQKFARFSRRVSTGLMIAAVLAAAIYFGPTIWRIGQSMLAERAESATVPVQPPTDLQEALASAPVNALTAGTAFRDCSACPEMVVLPGGLFVMGSPATEAGRGRDEGPQREVSIAPFAVSKSEITFQQWDACLAGGGCNGFSPADRGWGRGGQPVIGVSWNDAQAYVDWLNTQAGGLRYRLLSEAEWEYAARAGSRDAYSFGSSLTTAQATYRARRTDATASHEANAFGLVDVHGNAAEWVEDCYANTYALAPIDGAAVQVDDCSRRVYRGGSYVDQAPLLRAAARRAERPATRAPAVGFRVARAMD